MDELEVQRRKTRRKMAWVCVGLLCAITLATFGALLFSPARKEIASVLAVASGVLTTLLGVFATVIVSYFGASAVERVLKKEG